MQSTEHRLVGDAVRISDALVPQTDAGVITLTVTADNGQSIELTYGQIVALGGDFYATPTLTPISSVVGTDAQRDAFLAAFGTLRNADPVERQKILDIMGEEEATVAPGGIPVADPAAAFASLNHRLDYEWNVATGGCYGAVGMEQKPGRYAKIALANMDHFGDDAAAAYTAGHLAACQLAAQSKQLQDPLAMNAHADHFLTDLFASGHIRTPRRLLNDTAWYSPVKPTTMGAVLALCMHNEENATGLTVNSTVHPDTWEAVGDSHILCPNHQDHFTLAVAAVKQSISEVVEAAQTGTVPSSTALDHRPVVSPTTYPPTGGPSIAPMLIAGASSSGSAQAMMRYDPNGHHFDYPLGGQDCYHYTYSYSWVDILGPHFNDFFWPGK